MKFYDILKIELSENESFKSLFTKLSSVKSELEKTHLTSELKVSLDKSTILFHVPVKDKDKNERYQAIIDLANDRSKNQPTKLNHYFFHKNY